MTSKTINPLAALFFCFLLLSGVTSCKDDDEEEKCVAPALATQIEDTWQANITALGTSLGKVTLTFTQDGEVQGNIHEYLAMIPSIGAVDELIKYEVTGDTKVSIIGTSDGEPITPFDLTVTERDCEKIVLNTTGVVITLTK